MNYEQYYPTPAELGKRLAELIDKPQPPILEPSAGTGELIQAFREARKFNCWEYRYSERDFHCVELNANRAATLKGNDFIVVWEDFLTFNPLMRYQTIIMNPPFHDGAKHLQKALHILADGGEIACILNAETIRNPYTNERKALIQQLEAAEKYTCEFVQSAFDGTDVEVALIYVKKAEASGTCVTFDIFQRTAVNERKPDDPQALIRHGEINALIDRYRAEVEAAIYLYNEIVNYNRVCIHEQYNEIFSIKLNSHGAGHSGIVKAINYNYWYKLFHSKELDRLLTTAAVHDYSSKLREMSEYEFNERNILALKADLTAKLSSNLDAAIMEVWNNFTHRFSTDNTANIHYYNGWRTNKAFKCNKKVIIPLYAFDYIGERIDLFRIRDNLADIEKAMCYLDCGRTEASEMAELLMAAREQGVTRGIDTKFFIVDVYKKGTCHLTFKDMNLLKKFNLYCGRKLHWLPDDYGRKPYESLDEEERAVADSFEGRDSYRHTFNNRSFFIQDNSNLRLLASG